MEHFDITVKDVCFGYSDQEILHNVSFEAAPKSFVAVVGPNGGGKTTLLKLLLGLVTPWYGEIKIMGETPSSAAGHVGYVPQHIHFDPAFPITVLDTVLAGCSAGRLWGGFTKKERLSAMETLERVSLADTAARQFSSLSGGQRQRVLIAQALVASPKMLFLDEPTANVDAEVEGQIYRLLHDLNKDMTVVAVSHNLSVVTEYASHILCVSGTADMHKMQELSDGWIDGFGGLRFARIHHGAECQVSQPHIHDHDPHAAAVQNGDRR